MTKLTKLKTFTIDRARWLHAGNTAPTAVTLRDSTTFKMCCMGFFAVACGVRPRTLEGKNRFSDLPPTTFNKLPVEVRPSRQIVVEGHDTANTHYVEALEAETVLAEMLYVLNDDNTIDDDQREAALKLYFKRAGYDVEFVGVSQPKLSPHVKLVAKYSKGKTK